MMFELDPSFYFWWKSWLDPLRDICRPEVFVRKSILLYCDYFIYCYSILMLHVPKCCCQGLWHQGGYTVHSNCILHSSTSRTYPVNALPTHSSIWSQLILLSATTPLHMKSGHKSAKGHIHIIDHSVNSNSTWMVFSSLSSWTALWAPGKSMRLNSLTPMVADMQPPHKMPKLIHNN